jgi:hypothetical protein
MSKYTSLFFAFILIAFTGEKVNAEEEDESPIYTQYVGEVTSTFLKQVYKEFGIECGGSGGSMPYDVEEISVQLSAYRSATVEEARELEVMLTEKFVQIINAHEKLRPFLREYPFPSGRARIALSFEKPRKKKSATPEEDVAFVFQARNKIFYRAENPENPYVYKPIKDEPYEEARKIVQKNLLKKPPQEPGKNNL